jgi:hypothetical protein
MSSDTVRFSLGQREGDRLSIESSGPSANQDIAPKIENRPQTLADE